MKLFPKYRQGQTVILKNCRDEGGKNLLFLIKGRVWGKRINQDRQWYYHGEEYRINDSQGSNPLIYRRTAQWLTEDELLKINCNI